LAFVGKPFAFTICKILVIIRMKISSDLQAVRLPWEGCIEGEATDKNPLIESMVRCPSMQCWRSLMKEYLKFPIWSLQSS